MQGNNQKRTANGTRLSAIDMAKLNKSSIVSIAQRFYITTLHQVHQQFNAYNGVDLETGRWVTIYIKVKTNKYPFSAKIKEEFRNIICPKVIWEGQLDLSQGAYYVEVHDSCGPSLRKLFERIKTPISPKELLHLLYELIRLVQKMSNGKHACGQLTPDCIHFDSNPKKSDLYMFNCFHLGRKGDTRKPMRTKYCSRGSHLGRNLLIKDDLESIIYILMDLFSPHTFLEDCKVQDYSYNKLALKLEQYPRQLPMAFREFYCDVVNLNFDAEFNFFHWKNYLGKLLTPDIISQPYSWVSSKGENNNKQNIEEVFQEKELLQKTLKSLHETKENIQHIEKSLRTLDELGEKDNEIIEVELDSLDLVKRQSLVERIMVTKGLGNRY